MTRLAAAAALDIGKAKPDAITDQTRAVAALAGPYARALERWAAMHVRLELAAATADPRAYARRTKAEKPPPPGSLAALRALMIRFGIARAVDAGNAAAGKALFRGSLVSDAVGGKKIKIKVFEELVEQATEKADALAHWTQLRIRESVRDVIAEADAEVDGEGRPRKVTLGEIARRISRTVHAVEPENGPDPGKAYVFSPERAETIARTELAQVENTARVAGYRATGIEEIEWLAYTDGKSGDRHHERMKGVRVKIGEKFTLPSGKRLRWPGDPMGPVSETANCRCTIKPIRAKRPTAP